MNSTKWESLRSFPLLSIVSGITLGNIGTTAKNIVLKCSRGHRQWKIEGDQAPRLIQQGNS